MLSQLKFFILLLINIKLSYCAKEIPPFLHVCARNLPDIKQCIIKSVDDLRPYLKSGNAEYNIPSVEPIIIKDLIKEESNGLKIATSDVIAYGGGNYIVRDVNVDFDKQTFDVDILLPKLTVKAKYSLEGKLVLVPLKGSGDFYANLTDCGAMTKLKSEYFQVNGEKHIKFTQVDMKIQVGKGQVRLENLFGGEKTLSDIINETINKNFDIFLKELLPYIERGLAENFKATGNQIVEPYTVDQLFPPN